MLWIEMPTDQISRPLQLYYLERYLFDTVGPKFRKVGHLTAFDFFCIVIWKANRAKSRIAQRLLEKDPKRRKRLDPIVVELTASIHSCTSGGDRLRLLFEIWGFRLPMASAILTVLYPDEFTVYDERVGRQISEVHKKLANKTNMSAVWQGYREFVIAVKDAVPGDLSLRDKDRVLWGLSFCDDLNADIESCFEKRERATNE
jgi:hypothetical protein